MCNVGVKGILSAHFSRNRLDQDQDGSIDGKVKRSTRVERVHITNSSRDNNQGLRTNTSKRLESDSDGSNKNYTV